MFHDPWAVNDVILRYVLCVSIYRMARKLTKKGGKNDRTDMPSSFEENLGGGKLGRRHGGCTETPQKKERGREKGEGGGT